MKRHTFCMKIVMDKVSKVCVNCFFDQCIDKDQLDKRTVYEGCTKALETLLKMELLTIK